MSEIRTLSSSESMRRQPQVKAGCCSSATCSSLLAKAAMRLLLTSPFMALKTRDRNMGDLPDLAASGCSSTAYSALQHTHGQVNTGVLSFGKGSYGKGCRLVVAHIPLHGLKTRDRNMGALPTLAASGCSSTAYSALEHTHGQVRTGAVSLGKGAGKGYDLLVAHTPLHVLEEQGCEFKTSSQNEPLQGVAAQHAHHTASLQNRINQWQTCFMSTHGLISPSTRITHGRDCAPS